MPATAAGGLGAVGSREPHEAGTCPLRTRKDGTPPREGSEQRLQRLLPRAGPCPPEPHALPRGLFLQAGPAASHELL